MAWVKRPFFGTSARGAVRQNFTAPERGRKREPWVKPRPDRWPRSKSQGRLSGVLLFAHNGKVVKLSGRVPVKR